MITREERRAVAERLRNIAHARWMTARAAERDDWAEVTRVAEAIMSDYDEPPEVAKQITREQKLTWLKDEMAKADAAGWIGEAGWAPRFNMLNAIRADYDEQ